MRGPWGSLCGPRAFAGGLPVPAHRGPSRAPGSCRPPRPPPRRGAAGAGARRPVGGRAAGRCGRWPVGWGRWLAGVVGRWLFVRAALRSRRWTWGAVATGGEAQAVASTSASVRSAGGRPGGRRRSSMPSRSVARHTGPPFTNPTGSGNQGTPRFRAERSVVVVIPSRAASRATSYRPAGPGPGSAAPTGRPADVSSRSLTRSP